MILVSGCVKIDSDIKVNSDFSGKWQAVVQSQVGPLSRGDVEQEIRKTGLTGYTVYPISNEGKVIKDKDAKGAFPNWQIEAEFKNSQELAKLGHALGTVGGRDIRDGHRALQKSPWMPIFPRIPSAAALWKEIR